MRERLETKEQIVNAIAELIGVEAPKMSTGSTEPRQIFDITLEALGQTASSERRPTKPAAARRIVEAAGFPWLPNFESRGGTVTRDGLLAVYAAVKFFKGVE